MNLVAQRRYEAEMPVDDQPLILLRVYRASMRMPETLYDVVQGVKNNMVANSVIAQANKTETAAGTTWTAFAG
jgi:hypothetical protein